MGYYVNITESTAAIDRTFEAEAVRRFHALAGKDMDFAKSGGSWGGGGKGKTEAWYSWMGDDEMLKAKTLEDIFTSVGFECEATVEGDAVAITGYDSKTGQEDFFLFALRDLFQDGSYIRWSGEDGAIFEYLFEDGDFFYRQGGWEVTPPTKQRLRIFSYGFAKGELYVDLADARTPQTDEEKAGAAFPESTAPFLVGVSALHPLLK